MSEVEFKILELREQITHLEVKRNDLQLQMSEQLELKQQAVEMRRSQARLLRRKEQLELAITLLTERKDNSQSACEGLRASNEARREALTLARTRLAQARREQVEETLEPVTQALLWHYSEKAKKVSKLRRALIKQLVDLFQLGEDDEGKPTIVGIKLDPDRLSQGRDYRGEDKTPPENISSGLGWVVHFLDCVCKYLDLVPPHAMKFHGSKSAIGGVDGEYTRNPQHTVICGGVSDGCLWCRAGTKFELVADGNGIRQETFKVGMRLLNTNVCWLCGLAGDRPPRGKENRLLENLKRLADASRLGWEGPLRIVQSEIESEIEDLVAVSGMGMAGRSLSEEMEPEPEPLSVDDFEAPEIISIDGLLAPPDFSAPFPGTEIRDSRMAKQGMGEYSPAGQSPGGYGR